MKIQCDVCTKDEASVFCTADEAALCDACDHRVHHANKLAGKHQRFSLLPVSPTNFSLCDICKEKRAFVFCQQDRAILCRDCDFSIHKANELTRDHIRFLLTGIKLSATSAVYSTASDSVPHFKSGKGTEKISVKKPVSVGPASPNSPNIAAAAKTIMAVATGTDTSESTTSSISEYLIETLPGWRVEDLLDFPPPSSFGFSKIGGDVYSIWDVDLESNLTYPFSSPENMGIWVPQAPPPQPLVTTNFPTHQYPSSIISFGGQIGFKESKEVSNNESSREWIDDGCLIVPQISPPTATSKRSRNFW